MTLDILIPFWFHSFLQLVENRLTYHRQLRYEATNVLQVTQEIVVLLSQSRVVTFLILPWFLKGQPQLP